MTRPRSLHKAGSARRAACRANRPRLNGRWLAILPCVAFATLAGAAELRLPDLQVGHFSAADLDAARLQAAQPMPPPEEWEGQPSEEEVLLYERSRGNADNDTGHIIRGSTVVVHIFIDHTGRAWTQEERNAAGAQDRLAKDWIREQGSLWANIHWDHDGTSDYWYWDASVDQLIPPDGMTYGIINQILTDWGFADWDGDVAIVDDFTLYLQQNLGFDNVISSWEPAQTGRSWSGLGLAYNIVYQGVGAGVYAHEWGHVFGFCDEYVDHEHCDGGTDCGPCRNWYLQHIPNNANCDLPSCTSHVPCVMRSAALDDVCIYTNDGWGWRDGDGDTFLDPPYLYLPGGGTVLIYEIPEYGWFSSNDATNAFVAPIRTRNWTAIGMRSPSDADYDLQLYADNNHNFPLASSAYGTGAVDFVVGDYNHAEPGDEHLSLSHYSGSWNSYTLDFEGGGEMLFADGVKRPDAWPSYEVVRVYDVPLFAGERVPFTLEIDTPSLDLGMALFRSNAGRYWVGRAGAVAERDWNGAGGTEEFSYSVPETDVYGLVVFAKTAVDGSFSIRIGGSPVTLAEESPVTAGGDFRLYNYDPNSNYWSFAGGRPDAGTDVRLVLCLDQDNQLCPQNRDDAGASGLEFAAVDYNHAFIDRDYLRVLRKTGVGNHTVEWEHDPEIASGITTGWWTPGHLGKVWDVGLTGSRTYFIRQYQAADTPLDGGLYLLSSVDGQVYQGKGSAVAQSDFRAPAEGGEWLSYTAPQNDWYGLYLVANTAEGGSYSIWNGPRVPLADGTAVAETEPVAWGEAYVAANYWTVFASRPTPGVSASIWLYGDAAYSAGSFLADDQTSNPVVYIVGDFNHAPWLTTYYPRFWKGGAGSMSLEWEGGADQLAYLPGGAMSYDLAWAAGNVAEGWDVYVDGATAGGRNVRVDVTDLSGAMDLAVALFASNGAAYFANAASARAQSDASGTGGAESFTVHLTANDWYGLVVTNKTTAGGAYRIRVSDPGAASVEEAADRFSFRVLSANPGPGPVGIEFSLVSAAVAHLSVYDVRGREVRTLVAGARPAGSYLVSWDGRDAAGKDVPSGIYLARLQCLEGRETMEAVRKLTLLR